MTYNIESLSLKEEYITKNIRNLRLKKNPNYTVIKHKRNLFR